MAKPDFVRYSALALYADEHQMRRVNRFSADTSFLDEDILELTNNGVAETIDTLDSVSVTVDCHEFGSTENLAKAVNFFQAGDVGATANSHYITDGSFDKAQVDFMLKLTSGTNNDPLAASCWYGSCWLSGFTASYSADGNATESYTFEGEYKRWFTNAYRDTYVFSGTRTSSTQSTVYGQTLQSTHTGRVLTVNGLVKADVKAGGSSAISLTDSGSDTIVSATDIDGNAVTFNAGDRVRLVAPKTAPASLSQLATTPAGIGALRRGMIDIYLYNGTSGNAEKTLRLQSVDLNVSLDRAATPELGSQRNYARILNRPINVEVSAEALMSDLEMFAKIANKESEFDAMSLNEIDTDDFTNDTTVVIKLYKSETNHAAANLLKTITISDLTMSSDGFSIDAGGNATVSITLNGTGITVEGNSVSPIL